MSYTPSLVQLLELQHQATNRNTFPDYRGVLDGNVRTLWQFGGREPRDYANTWAKHFKQPVVISNVKNGIPQKATFTDQTK